MSIVDEVKARLDILDEVSASVKLKRAGKNHTGMCPFHDNKRTPSFVVFPGTGTWRCFGSCNTGGDIISFVMKRDGCDFQEALRKLAGKAGVEMRPMSPEEQRKIAVRREREEILAVIAEFFRRQMGAPAMLPVRAEDFNEGLKYAVYERKWETETIRNANLGYFGRDWDGIRHALVLAEIDPESPAAVAFVGYRGDVAAWGMKWGVKPAPGWVEDKKIPAMPPNMLMYVHLHRGRCVYISGRKLETEDGHAKSWNPPSELVGERQAYFNHIWSGEKDPKHLVIVEGQGDAVTLAQWGILAVALAGSGNLRPETLTNGEEEVRTDNVLLSELKRKIKNESSRAKASTRIVVALDQDEPGKKLQASVIEALCSAGIGPTQIAMLEWPEKDANAWLQAGGTAKAAADALASAESLLEALILSAEPIGGKSDDEAVQKLFAELAKLNPFEIEKVREVVCERLNLRRRVFDGLLKAARRDAGKGDDGQPAYFVEGGRVFARSFDARGGETVEALCNFSAFIQGDVLRDNGQDVIREFHIRGAIGKHNLPTARVKAEDFAKMEWPISAWGSRAIIEAGARRRDQLRAAIQHLSKEVKRMTIYTHTGWREVENGNGAKRIYLTAAGAVGGEAVDVELDRDLDLYQVPTVAQNPGEAMALSLSYLDIAPDRIAFPIWAGMYLAPLRDLVNVAFSLWIYGASGTMKSTYAALGLNHYGPGFDDKHLPANFTDTANRLEQKSFVIKDAPLLIDDFAPQKDQRSYTEYTRTAHRIVRAAGNLAGRGRLTADASARTTYDPRSLVIITGEDLPESESLVARLYVVEVNRGDVDKVKLSSLQGKRDRLCHAMSGYLTWASESWPGWVETIPKAWREYRQRAFEAGYHLRLPEAVAGLMIGSEMGLRYASALGVISSVEYARYMDRAWAALQDGASAMSNRVKEEKPEALFLRTLSDLITQGKITFKGTNGLTNLGGDPTPLAEMLGWYDHDWLYLLPDATYNRIAKHFREQGNVFPVREVTLRKMLAEGGMIKVVDGRRTPAVSLEGVTRRVMMLKRSFLNEEEGK
jgi:DNA primase